MKHEPVKDHAERKRILSLIERCEKERMMSKDIIYREDAIKALCDAVDNKDGGEWLYTDEFCKVINSIPSAERPQGEWIEIGTISHSYKCSVCGRTLFNITVGKNHVAKYYPYCHCGAKMKGEDDDIRINR